MQVIHVNWPTSGSVQVTLCCFDSAPATSPETLAELFKTATTTLQSAARRKLEEPRCVAGAAVVAAALKGRRGSTAAGRRKRRPIPPLASVPLSRKRARHITALPYPIHDGRKEKRVGHMEVGAAVQRGQAGPTLRSRRPQRRAIPPFP